MIRRAEAGEVVGTGLLVYVIVGSGIAIDQLAADPASSLVLHAVAVGVGLGVLVALFASVSGGHFNPAVTIAMWRRHEMGGPEARHYVAAQVVGSTAGLFLALYSFGRRPALPSTGPIDWGTVAAEAVGTAILVLIVLGLATDGHRRWIRLLVGGWVGVAIVASSSTGLLNPAVTLARVFTDSYTAVPANVAGVFVVAQLSGALAAVFARNSPLHTPRSERNLMPVLLTTGEQLQVRQAAERLQRQFAGSLNTETIERFMNDSLETLMSRATTTGWIPLLAERFARGRLRALIRLESDPTTLNPSILFLCVHNAGRSQMAAGWARRLGGDQIDVFSGGSEPADQVNRAAVEAMAEVGIDISGEIPQPWADEIVRAADVVVTMGCGDACPVYPGKRYLDWELDDPSGRTLEEVRPIRDELEKRVRALLAELLPD